MNYSNKKAKSMRKIRKIARLVFIDDLNHPINLDNKGNIIKKAETSKDAQDTTLTKSSPKDSSLSSINDSNNVPKSPKNENFFKKNEINQTIDDNLAQSPLDQMNFLDQHELYSETIDPLSDDWGLSELEDNIEYFI